MENLLHSHKRCDIYKDEHDAVNAYRNYYNGTKTRFAKWKNGKVPHWFRSETLHSVITFKTLSWRNFLSTGNYKTTLDLTRHNNTLVSGENGAGKSTMLDALTFALFGKSFRGITLPQLANSINEKDCEVEIEFSVGSTEYRVIRGISPKKFEIYKDGVLIPQEASLKIIKSILKIKLSKCHTSHFVRLSFLVLQIMFHSCNSLPQTDDLLWKTCWTLMCSPQ